jgi:cyclic 2,3-diphosphoglycerate synthase
MKVIALVDGEHYPSVTRWALASARASGYEVAAALLVGGTEKLDAERRLDLDDVPLIRGRGRPMTELADAIGDHRPDGVLDLSDEPVLSYERRMELICVTLAGGLPYVGPDFRFDPPITDAALPVPTLAVIGTGKRVAKTAVAGHVARLAATEGLAPTVVAMGRGGPPEPVVAGALDVSVEALVARVERGEHAASDFLEDALTAGVPTVGARRAGGGLAGRPFVTNVAAAAAKAVEDGAGLVVLEGSGASLPTVPWDAGILVVPATLPPEHLAGYLGPLRVLLSDLVVFMIGAGPTTGPNNLSTLGAHARRLRADIRVAIAELHPVPLADVREKDAFFATTADPVLAGHLAAQLEDSSGCRVVTVSSNLADRAALEHDLAAAPPFDVLLTELKAAAIDVAARRALDRGAEVVFVDNRPVQAQEAESLGADGDLDGLLSQTLAGAGDRASARLERRSPG